MKIIKSDKHKKVTQSVWATFQPKTQTLYKAKTRLGNSFWMWKANPVSPENHKKQLSKGLNTQFACHGFTVGSYKLAGGPFTPYGDGIDILLADEFHTITVHELSIKDVIAWRDEDGDISHTARVSEIYRDQEHQLLEQTRLATKNGAGVLRDNMRLVTLKLKYGDCMEFYRDGKYNLRSSFSRF